MSTINVKHNSLRNSSIELLRIISMIMIVFHHFAVHGGFEWNTTEISIPHFWYNLIIMGGKIGVDIFVLISGYFLIENNKTIFNLKRTLKFWGQVFFYSIAIYIVFMFVGSDDLEIKSLVKTLFPITFSKWWFASSYFVLYLVHPFLNKLLNQLDKKTYQSLLVMLILLWCIIPTFTTSEYQSNSFLWFVTLYSVAGYARIYGFNDKIKCNHYFMLGFIFSILTYMTSVTFMIMGSRWHIFSAYVTYFYGQEKLSILLISLSIFMAFAKLKMNYHKTINFIASATFGVYLIHDNDTVKAFLWQTIFKNAQYQNSIFLIPYSIIVVASVYISCTIIDLIRKSIFEKPYMMLVDKYADKIEKPFSFIITRAKNLIFGKQ